MPAVLRSEKLDKGIRGNRRIAIAVKRDQGVVLRGNHQNRDLYLRDEAQSRLRFVILVCGGPPESRSGDTVVNLIDGAAAGKVGQIVPPGATEPLLHALYKATLIQTIRRMVERLCRGGQVDGSGNGTRTGKVRAAILGGGLESNVTAQGESSDKHRRSGGPVLFQKRQQITGQTGVVQGLTQVFCAAAGAHVKAMDHEPSAKCTIGEADDISSLAAAFQAVEQNQLTANGSKRLMRLNQDLHFRFCLNEVGLKRKNAEIEAPRPIVTQNSEDVRVTKDRIEVQIAV